MVDLPGLIHATTNSQNQDDVAATLFLTEKYIQSKRTIILAIISAKNDYANQVIINLCQKFGATDRTLGIITKPDTLTEGGKDEELFIKLADNREVPLGCGWHLLKNSSTDTPFTNFQERNKSEVSFFKKGIYRGRDRNTQGIVPLRQRLCKLLQDHLRKELPGLKSELELTLSNARTDLKELGENASTISAKRQFLRDLLIELLRIVEAAMQGQYAHPFFKEVETTKAIDDRCNLVRLRNAIVFLNGRFTRHMNLHGHKYAISRSKMIATEPDTPADQGTIDFVDMALGGFEDLVEDESEKNPESLPDYNQVIKAVKPKRFSRPQAERWVLNMLQRCKGCELPGSYNSELIRSLFEEQSEPWKTIASIHIDEVAKVCQSFLHIALGDVTRKKDIQRRLYTTRIRDAFNKAIAKARKELDRLIDDKNGHPMAYNWGYTLAVKRLRKRRGGDIMKQVSHEVHTNISEIDGSLPRDFRIVSKQTMDLNALNELVKEATYADKFSASEALDSQLAHYAVG